MKPFYRQFNDIHKMCNEIHVSTKHCLSAYQCSGEGDYSWYSMVVEQQEVGMAGYKMC